MGIKEVFDPIRSNLGNLVPPPYQAFLSEAKHKAKIEVNEEGTKASGLPR